MLGVLALLSAALADCPGPIPPRGLVQRAAEAEAAFVALDAGAFDAAIAAMESEVACLGAPLSPEQAARVHAARALSAYLHGDEVRTIAAYQAALGADASVAQPDGLDAGHPIRMERRLAEKLPANEVLALEPAEGERLLVDGHLQDARVLQQPALLQRVRGDAVLDSALLRMDAPLPPWAPLAPERLSPEQRRKVWLGGLTTASSVTALVSWGVALRAYVQFQNDGTNYQQLPQLEQQANRFSTVAIVSGGVAAGSGAALVFVW